AKPVGQDHIQRFSIGALPIGFQHVPKLGRMVARNVEGPSQQGTAQKVHGQIPIIHVFQVESPAKGPQVFRLGQVRLYPGYAHQVHLVAPFLQLKEEMVKAQFVAVMGGIGHEVGKDKDVQACSTLRFKLNKSYYKLTSNSELGSPRRQPPRLGRLLAMTAYSFYPFL